MWLKSPKFLITYTVVLLLVVMGAVFFVFNFSVSAQGPDIGTGFVDDTGLETSQEDDIRVVIANIVRYLLTFVGLIAVIFILWAGYLWMVSGGDPTKVGQAKKTLINATIGLAIVILAFAIVTFMINLWSDFANGDLNNNNNGPGRVNDGIGALGNCTIETVYPEPGQKDVPRNTALIVTFREPVNPMTICGQPACTADNIIPDRVRIFESDLEDSCVYDSDADVWIDCSLTNISNVLVTSNDNKTFVFMPSEYLGSASANIWHTVHLSNEIELLDGRPVFDTCATDYFAWRFEVSNRVDLTPPQVKIGGVFPAPDNLPDTSVDLPSQQATGLIAISGDPLGRTDAATTTDIIEAPGSAPATISDFNVNHNQTGTLLIAVNPGYASVSVSNEDTGNLLGTYYVVGNSVELYNLFTLNLEVPFVAPWSWTVGVRAVVSADTIAIGNTRYYFVSDTPEGNEISVVGSIQNNIINTINPGSPNASGDSNVSASADGINVRLTARIGGEAGNNILLATESLHLSVSEPMHDGVDVGVDITTQGLSDKPRNAVIQITFNETINPLTVSGDAQSLQNYIRVICVSGDCTGNGFFACPGGTCVDGEFLVSNQYRVVEFLSNNECGVNSCGDPVYCLPENSNLRVEIEAATLDGCTNCMAKTPYTFCDTHCSTATVGGEFYPLSDFGLLDGVMDIALNSLDGDRSGDAEGPGLNYYNENSLSGICDNNDEVCTIDNEVSVCGTGTCIGAQALSTLQGTSIDNYQWTFWISDEIDISSPQINLPAVVGETLTAGDTDGTVPENTEPGVSLIEPLIINFNKVMMSASLNTGTVVSRNQLGEVEHRLLNLWNFNNYPTGYWVTSNNMQIGTPDNEPEWSQAELRHTRLGEDMTYRAQVGSGGRDIYQNCYKPSAGPACTGSEAVDEAHPSCCAGVSSPDELCD